jgi:sulfite reductase alpha subunit-like flavoprotein
MLQTRRHDAVNDLDSMIPRTPPPTGFPHILTKSITSQSNTNNANSPSSSRGSLSLTESNDLETPITPITEPVADEEMDTITHLSSVDNGDSRTRRASTSLLSQDGVELRRILGQGQTGTKLIQKYCCGGGCCLVKNIDSLTLDPNQHPVPLPDNEAFRSLKLNLTNLSMDTELTSIAPLPDAHVSFSPVSSSEIAKPPEDETQPPSFVQPHPPYHVYNATVYNARQLTMPGAEKRTYHFDLDVTDYPDEGGVDFKLGGAIGICPPNDDWVVEDIFDRLGVPKFVRDKVITLNTTGGRWPTIWGEEQPRQITTTRRQLLTWCCDLQSTPPTKQLLRVLAEYATDACEAKILKYLVSAEGQGAFCDIRTGPHLTLSQLLHAFPSSHPPLETLMSVLKQLMPRFYSLSNDPCISSERDGLAGRRLIEMAVSIHDTPDWRHGTRTGVGSGYLERIANQFLSSSHEQNATPIRIPMFRGLMANPLTREFTSDGPMLLIGAGVGMAPFRGFILNRLKNANCANKVWLLQGVRDSSLDELYRGELGEHETDVKRVVQSRRANVEAGEAKYVQEEVIHQGDVVWFVINAVDGRVCVCGSSQGMGEGVWDALVRVVMQKGGMNREEAETFWKAKEESGQYIAVSFCDVNA